MEEIERNIKKVSEDYAVFNTKCKVEEVFKVKN